MVAWNPKQKLPSRDSEYTHCDCPIAMLNSPRYNSRTHPLPFMKASNVVAPAKSTKEKPDLEEAFEDEDDGQLAEPKEEDEEADLKKDKYIKQPKVKKPAAAKKTPKQKVAKHGDEDEENSGEDVKPKKKAKAKPAAKGKGNKS